MFKGRLPGGTCWSGGLSRLGSCRDWRVVESLESKPGELAPVVISPHQKNKNPIVEDATIPMSVGKFGSNGREV